MAIVLGRPQFSSPATEPFRWQDGERVIVFGRDRLAAAGEILDPGYALLTTPRAGSMAPSVIEAAGSVHEIGPGRVDELAASLRQGIRGSVLVALGGGRVIDVAKALAAADPPKRVAAIPTTLSGAEMTSTHRHVAGIPADAARVRPAIVINDPLLSASQPLADLAQSAANALGHAVEGPLTPLGNPVAEGAGQCAARLLGQGLAGAPDETDRDALALGALLAGYVIGATGYGLHHVLSQTLARFAGVSHGAANAIMLPHSISALSARRSDRMRSLERALGCEPTLLAVHLRRLGGVERLRDAGVEQGLLSLCADEASRRPELHMIPPPAGQDELLELYEAAY